jgi:tRNA modification GTPase
VSAAPDADATLVACFTPPGAGAIATLALRGPLAWSIARTLFRIGRPPGKELPLSLTVGKHWLGRLGEDPRGACADDVMLVVKRAAPSPWLELHCHGGPEVVRYLLEILAAGGARPCAWQNLENTTAEEPESARALSALVEAPTVRTAAILLDQYHGAFGRAICAIRAALAGNNLEDAQARLADLVQYAPLGRHLTSPWRVVIAGAPNVGKSTLVNALAGFQRSVVAPTPGTTRDVVTTTTAIDGWPVELADTAGIRAEAGELEQMGIDLARAAAAQADLCLCVFDSTADLVFPAPGDRLVRYVVNKIDLPAPPGFLAPADAVHVSAILGQGIPDLCQYLSRWLVSRVPTPGAAVPYTPALCDRIEECLRLCSAGRGTEALTLLDFIIDRT